MTLYIDQDTLKRVNIYAPYKGRSRLTDASARAAVGVIEIADPAPPADYSEDTYYRTEQDDAPYVVYTRKSDDQIAWAHNDKVWMQINANEQQQLIPRVLREFLLEQPGADQKPWFAKIKAADDEIVALKAQLVPENPRPVMP